MIQSRVNIAVVILMSASGTCAADERGHLPEAVHRIERETGGKVLSAERSSHNGEEATRIKVYTPEGRVRVMWDQSPRERPALPEPAQRQPMVRPEMPRPEIPRSDMRQPTPVPTNSAFRAAPPHVTPVSQPPRRDRR